MANIDQMFHQLISEGGSDLHLEQGQRPKIRLNGRLKDMTVHPPLDQATLTGLLKEITEEHTWASFERSGDLDFAYAMGTTARFRANYFRHVHGYGGIFRIIPSDIKSLNDIGAPDVLKKFANLRSGLVLVTGPTGSGKSTTLAAIIDHINQHFSKKIITIEEPVEFMHRNKKSIITHREVGGDTPSFATGLKGSMKSDADIILVGEMRDRETIELALNAAEMGILVFGTLHTNSAAKSIDRIIDVFPSAKKNQIKSILCSVLKGVVTQQLVRSCDGTRRWPAHEVLLATSALTPIIMSGETMRLTSEIQVNRAMGMILMDDCLSEMVTAGKISKEEAHLKALDKVKFI